MPVHGNKYFARSLSLIVAFEFGSHGISWFWTDQRIVAVVLAVAPVVFSVLLLPPAGSALRRSVRVPDINCNAVLKSVYPCVCRW